VVKIVKARNVNSPDTPRGVTANPLSGSWHDEDQLTRRTVKSKKSVKRVHVKDPNNPIFYPEADQFSDNANPRYDPSKAPGSVKILDSTPEPPKGSTSGHQKVIQQTNQMKRGGKTLKRR
jgi:hypothetical protein